MNFVDFVVYANDTFEIGSASPSELEGLFRTVEKEVALDGEDNIGSWWWTVAFDVLDASFHLR